MQCKTWPLCNIALSLIRVWLQTSAPAASNEHLDAIAKAIKEEGEPTEFKYEERDVILYNLGVGAKRTDLKYIL